MEEAGQFILLELLEILVSIANTALLQVGETTWSSPPVSELDTQYTHLHKLTVPLHTSTLWGWHFDQISLLGK